MDEGFAPDQLGVFVGYSADAQAAADVVHELQSDLQRELDEAIGRGSVTSLRRVRIWRWDRDLDGRPQGQTGIDRHLAAARIAVFVFAGRAGPVTRQEIEHCRRRGIPTCVCFPKQPPDGADMLDKAVREAWNDLADYREALQDDWTGETSTSPKPLDPYGDLTHLREVLWHQLGLDLGVVLRGTPTQPQPPPSAAPPDPFAGYRAWVRERHARLTMRGLGRDDIRLPLDRVFVPLRLSTWQRHERGLGQPGRGEAMPGAPDQDVPIERVLASADPQRPDVAIFGQPGAGKSTLLRQLAMLLLDRPGQVAGAPSDPLPVLVPLRHFRRADLDQDLAAFLGRALRAESAAGKDAANAEAATAPLDATIAPDLWARGRLVLLLDGLDEIRDDELRKDLCKWLRTELTAGRAREVRAVLSCRSAYRSDLPLDEFCSAVEVRPLDKDECRSFVTTWFGVAADHVPGFTRAELLRRAERLADTLSDPAQSNQDMLRVVSAPLMLTLLCVVVLREGDMPKRRVAFYEQCCDVLLRRWRHAQHQEEPPLLLEPALAVLSAVAQELHEAGREDDLRQNEFARMANAVLEREQVTANPVQVLRWLIRDAGVLDRCGPNQHRFMHRGLQEYLCATAIARSGAEGVGKLAARAVDPHWREVTLLAVGLPASRPEDRVFGTWCRAVLQRADWRTDECRALLRDALRDALQPDLAPLVERLGPDQDRRALAAVLELLQGFAEPAVVAACERLVGHADPTVAGLAAAVVDRARRHRLQEEGKGREVLVVGDEPDRARAAELVSALLAGGVGAFQDADWAGEGLERLLDEKPAVVVIAVAGDLAAEPEEVDALALLRDGGARILQVGGDATGAIAWTTAAKVAAQVRQRLGLAAEAARRAVPGVGTGVLHAQPQAGDRVVLDLGNGVELVLLGVPGGEFRMGGEIVIEGKVWQPSLPVHRVAVSPFWLGATPVTNRQYAVFLEATGGAEPHHWRDPRFSDPEQPVVGVSWDEAQAYCAWLHQRIAPHGLRVGLPTEAQWERAARDGDERPFPWGTDEPRDDLACFGRDWQKGRPDRVGLHPLGRGPYGHDDLAGLVWEWCADGWDADAYKRRAKSRRVVVDPWIGREGGERVLRGGGWYRPAQDLRSAGRGRSVSRGRHGSIGFRIVVAPSSTEALTT